MAETKDETEVIIEERYTQLEKDKSDYIDRAERNAKITIPFSFPEDGFKSGDEQDLFLTQGFNASLVSHLVGKLGQVILPSSRPFFKLDADVEAVEAVSQDNPQAKMEILKMLSAKEDLALKVINKKGFKTALSPALELACIAGNCMIELLDEPDNKGSYYRIINLKDYVVSRNYKGIVEELILKETLSYETAPEEVRTSIADEDKQEDITLYTYVKRVDNKYVMTQEANKITVGSKDNFDEFTDRFIDFTWDLIDGEDYARSFIDKIYSTMALLEKSTKIFVEGIAEAVKDIKFVNPNGSTEYEAYIDASHGDAIMGDARDITSEQNTKTMDLRVMKDFINELKQELSRTFLVTGSGIRDSERTTAYEVDVIAREAEQSLEGFYSSIATKVQIPVVKQSLKEIKVDLNDEIELVITGGVQALSRGVELQKINGLMQELQMLAGIVGAEAVAKTVNVGAITSAIVANSGVAGNNFLYNETQIAEKEGMQKQEAMAEEAVMSGARTAGTNAVQPQQQG